MVVVCYFNEAKIVYIVNSVSLLYHPAPGGLLQPESHGLVNFVYIAEGAQLSQHTHY